jgi:malonate-semialdehyde dehydrogenase (acetylating)/methylmalonate-semialdehyde dehydrogenase
MAISVAVFVGESKQWIAELQAQMAELQPGYWNDPAAAFGPLISQQAKQRVQRLISEGKAYASTPRPKPSPAAGLMTAAAAART